jgi:hydrogenase maturation protease
MQKVLVLGLGNDLLTDDAVGLHVAAEVRRRLGGDPVIAVKSTMEMGSGLLDLIAGCERLVIVDSIQTGRAPAGHVHLIEPHRFRRHCTRAPHALGIEETCALGRSLGMPMPTQVRIVAIEVKDPFTMGTDMTPAVERAIEDAADAAVECAREFARAAPLAEA